MYKSPPRSSSEAAAQPTPSPTPMMAQYLQLKAESGDCLLFYRMGDFYELFFDDAVTAAAVLDIALTRRGQHAGADVPMCGVPVHSAQGYLVRLIRAGHRVAIADQVEDPTEARKRGAKAVVARAIVRIVTPGTLTEDDLLDARTPNLLAALAAAEDRFGLAWCDLSTGEFATLACEPAALAAELARLAPSELLAPEGVPPDVPARRLPAAAFDSSRAERMLKARFAVSTLAGFGTFSRAELAAAGALIDYLDATQRAAVTGLQPPRPEPPAGTMAIDAATRASLELVRSADGRRDGSLLAVLDRTLTAAGARLLARELAAPSTDPAVISARLALVDWFVEAQAARSMLRSILRSIPDFQRAFQRVALKRGSPRDLAMLRDGLANAAEARARLTAASPLGEPALLGDTLARIADLGGLRARLEAALVAQPPADAAASGFIAAGFDAELDALRALGRDARQHIAALEAQYRAQTGIAALKLRHNNVLGYHIEVPARHGEALLGPDSGFAHRQTLAGAMRFNSVALAELAQRIAGAEAAAAAREQEHMAQLCAVVVEAGEAIAHTAAAMARLDVASGLAERAVEGGWTRPAILAELTFRVEGGRHPVVEAARAAQHQPFIANDCDLSPDRRLWLVTGPNMAGKSTFLRANALIAVLAQCGSFVPAARAEIGIVDRLFSRVGAADNLAQGQSTFMVEMVETAAILRQAGPRSLVVLDEVGRGTSTYDGLALAWAIVEALHDQLQCRALFATHYHELTALAARLPCVHLATSRVREFQGELVFLHEIAAGAADRSYGLAVARLAGVPEPVIARAREVLARLEAGRAASGGMAAPLADLPLFAAAPAAAPGDGLRKRLAAIRPDDLSPRAALELVYELKRLASEGEGA